MCPSNHSKQTMKPMRTNSLISSSIPLTRKLLSLGENAKLDAEDIDEDLGLYTL
jgi:hypothetical protein